MSGYRDIQDADRRLSILLILRDSDGYNANEHLIGRALDSFGHGVSADRVRGDIAWLTEQGLASHTTTGGLIIATLTRRGDDVANGRTRVPGVARPRPED